LEAFAVQLKKASSGGSKMIELMPKTGTVFTTEDLAATVSALLAETCQPRRLL
jgi:hypothetical protein